MTHTYKFLAKNIDDNTTPNVILRTSDGIYIPFDEANTDYQEYLAWLDAGNTPDLSLIHI